MSANHLQKTQHEINQRRAKLLPLIVNDRFDEMQRAARIKRLILRYGGIVLGAAIIAAAVLVARG